MWWVGLEDRLLTPTDGEVWIVRTLSMTILREEVEEW